jgi:hypothetical protein
MARDLIKDYVAARMALHQEKERISQRLAEIDQVLGSADEAPAAKPAPASTVAKVAPAKSAKPKKRGKMSAEGRARIAAAQKKRWAKV